MCGGKGKERSSKDKQERGPPRVSAELSYFFFVCVHRRLPKHYLPFHHHHHHHHSPSTTPLPPIVHPLPCRARERVVVVRGQWCEGVEGGGKRRALQATTSRSDVLSMGRSRLTHTFLAPPPTGSPTHLFALLTTSSSLPPSLPSTTLSLSFFRLSST